MQMQEPQQRQQSYRQQVDQVQVSWQETGREQEQAFREGQSSEYTGGYGGKQPVFDEIGDYQGQKIRPRERLKQRSPGLAVAGIIVAVTGYFFSILGIIFAADRLSAHLGPGLPLALAIFALVGSILLLLACVGIFVVSIIVVTRWKKRNTWPYRGSGYRSIR